MNIGLKKICKKEAIKLWEYGAIIKISSDTYLDAYCLMKEDKQNLINILNEDEYRLNDLHEEYDRFYKLKILA